MLIAGAILVLGIGLILLIRQQTPSPRDDSYEYTDSDTGEVVSVQPGVKPEQYGNDANEPLLLGLSTLGDYGSAGLTPDQLPVFKRDLLENGIKQIGSYDKTLKIVKLRLNPTTYLLEADLLYKEGSSPILVTFKIPNAYVFEYNLTLDGKMLYASKRILIDGITEEPPDSAN